MLSTARKMATGPTQIMVVNDSAVVRVLITRVLGGEAGFEMVSSVVNGRAAASALPRHEIYVVVLDI